MTSQRQNPPTQKLWKSLQTRASLPVLTEQAGGEFPAGASDPLAVPPLTAGLSRRRFLSLASASAAFAAAGCSRPHDRGDLVPYTKKPPEITPGVANYYASTYQEGLDSYGILVKAREGRPIHVEGNAQHPRSHTAPARALAEILNLYDPKRVQQPMLQTGDDASKEPKSWGRAQKDVLAALAKARKDSAGVLVMTPAVLSPTRQKLLDELARLLPGLRHVAWEPLDESAALGAVEQVHGERLRPQLHLDRAKVVLSLGADFLGTMGDAAGSIEQFAQGRRVRKTDDAMSRLYVAESRMSLTGANADHRMQLRPSAIAAVALALAATLQTEHGIALPEGADPKRLGDLEELAKTHGLDAKVLAALAKDLAASGKDSLVLTGPELPEAAHVAGHLLNQMLGAVGRTITFDQAAPAPKLASRDEIDELIKEMDSGTFAVAVLWDVNPIYALPQATAFASALQNVPVRVRLGMNEDETSDVCQIIMPTNHWLESWGDYTVDRQWLSVQQPLIAPLFDTRQAEEIVLEWMSELGGRVPRRYLDYLRRRWEQEVFPDGSAVGFDAFWTAAVHDGVGQRSTQPRSALSFAGAAVNAAAQSISETPVSGMELLLHADHKLYDGRHADNGWLQELPDPITKVVWGNPALICAADARELRLRDGDLVKLETSRGHVTVPVIVQPGQTKGVVSLALGYGRAKGDVATGIGANAFPLLPAADEGLVVSVTVSRVGGQARVVRTQDHHTIGDLRQADLELVKRQDLADYRHSHEHAEHEHDSHGGAHGPSLYPGHKSGEEKWGMVIDLNACVGCSNCVVACQSENNVPVVGPDQTGRGREMHWIRLDRYYSGDVADPEVRMQPMLCQHCDNAPCESVCPVAATTHSPDGLNQMTYNRCVGTRYCANNCPYKVRRFNFFDFTQATPTPRELAFNPEVTVRPRGVMEKCTFCIQRIQDARQRAKQKGRPVVDGDFQTACEAACPARAITFGNLNNPESQVAKLAANNRGYKVLGELGVGPAITYLTKLRNRVETSEADES